MKCIICSRRIPRVRLEAQPNSKTCGRLCALLRRKNVRTAIDARWRQRKKGSRGLPRGKKENQ